jgi:hypothetical protein
MQRLEVSGAVRHIYMYVVRWQRVKEKKCIWLVIITQIYHDAQSTEYQIYQYNQSSLTLYKCTPLSHTHTKHC